MMERLGIGIMVRGGIGFLGVSTQVLCKGWDDASNGIWNSRTTNVLCNGDEILRGCQNIIMPY